MKIIHINYFEKNYYFLLRLRGRKYKLFAPRGANELAADNSLAPRSIGAGVPCKELLLRKAARLAQVEVMQQYFL